MVAYLSAEWFSLANEALATRASLGEQWREHPIVVQQVIEGAPTPRYVLVLDGSGPSLEPGQVEHPTATFTVGYPTAVAIAQGTISAQSAFQAGDLHIDGEVTTLIAGLERLATVDDVLADLRAATEY